MDPEKTAELTKVCLRYASCQLNSDLNEDKLVASGPRKGNRTYACAVDAVINPPKALDHVLGSLFHRLFLRDVDLQRLSTEVSSSCYGSTFGGNAACSFNVHVRDKHADSTVFGQAEGARSSYATSLAQVSIPIEEPDEAVA